MTAYERSRAWALAHPEETKVAMHKYDMKRKFTRQIKDRDVQLRRNYGITLEEYNRLFSEQNGLCLGCYKHQSQVKRAFDVDHNHITGKVRGLLCSPCNVILGMAKDNPQTLERLISYLTKGK